MANGVYTAIQYFIGLHPETKDLRWFYTGESHAGRYCPALAYWTLKYNEEINSGNRTGELINL